MKKKNICKHLLATNHTEHITEKQVVKKKVEIFILLSANAFSFDKSKFLSCAISLC